MKDDLNKIIRLRIVRNKANNQCNITPRKTDLPRELRDKLDHSKFMKIKLRDFYFE